MAILGDGRITLNEVAGAEYGVIPRVLEVHRLPGERWSVSNEWISTELLRN